MSSTPRLSWLLLVLGLAGCGSKPTAQPPAAPELAAAAASAASASAATTTLQASAPPACPFPDSFQDAAPDWLCKPPSSVDALMTARGVHDGGSPAQPADVLQARAEHTAKAELVQHLASHVRSLFQQYMEANPKLAPAGVITKLESSLAAQAKPELLTGTRLMHSATSPKGVAYVQLNLPQQQVQANALRLLQASMKADKTHWQKLRTKLKPDALAKAIASGSAP